MFDELKLKAATEAAVIAAHKNLAKLSLFTTNFRELEGKYGESIAVPVYDFTEAATFSAQNNYGSGTNEVSGELITLNQHLVKSVSISDKEEAETGINWAKDTATALADILTRGVNDTVFALFTSTNIPASETWAPTDLDAIAQLGKIAADNDIPVDKAVVVLNTAYFYQLLGKLPDSVYGGREAIVSGIVPGLYGFKGVVCAPNLPDGLKGAILADTALGVASRYLAPYTADAYPEAFPATDENGFTLGFRRFMDLSMGENKFACDCLFGAKFIQPSKAVRLVAE